MQIHLLRLSELEEKVQEIPELDFWADCIVYNTEPKEAKPLQNSLNTLLEDKLPEQIPLMVRKLEEETQIPADYLMTDIFGAEIYLQTSTHQRVKKSNDIVGRFVTRLRSNQLEPRIENHLHDEVRDMLIKTKAFTHNLQYAMEGSKTRLAPYQDGLLIADGTKENFENLHAFLNDYMNTVTSQQFYENTKKAHNILENNKTDLFEGFL